MRFYTNQHPFYCGIDLHARSMYVCIVSHDGDMLLHRNMKAAPAPFLQAVAPYRDGLVVAVECIFTWYWLADLCAAEGIPFVLGQTTRSIPKRLRRCSAAACFHKPMSIRRKCAPPAICSDAART